MGEISNMAAITPQQNSQPDDVAMAYGQLFRVIEDMRVLIGERDAALQQTRRAQQELMTRLAAASVWNDGEAGPHIVRIGLWSAMLATWLGLPDDECERIFRAAPMHDIGKVGLRDAFSRSTSALGDDESKRQRQHVNLGAKLLGGSDIPELQLAADIAQSHHERFDGGGYPLGLIGEAIPIAARIVALVDCFGCLTMSRPYQPTMSDADAANIISMNRGGQFDPVIVDCFLAHLSQMSAAREAIEVMPASLSALTMPEGFWRRFV
ncbi:HD domain-containing protein [Burkholderiaceae bacterium DAT-1]|nr:HD domain-containing protein [Burkholderiaceae bacterium DAT-1]